MKLHSYIVKRDYKERHILIKWEARSNMEDNLYALML